MTQRRTRRSSSSFDAQLPQGRGKVPRRHIGQHRAPLQEEACSHAEKAAWVPDSSSSSPGSADDKTLRCDHFSVQVLDSSDNPKQIYGLKREGTLVEAYIEAKEDEQFRIKVDSSVQDGTYCAKLEVGGRWCEDRICRFRKWPIIFQGRQISASEFETLKFCKVTVSDDEFQSIRDPAEVARMGQISITMRKVASRNPCIPTFPQGSIAPTKAIYEKTKKLGALQFGTGPVVSSGHQNFFTCTYDETFTLSFKICCVTRIGLQLLGLISPDLESERRREKEMEAEEKRLEKELNELRKRRRLLNSADRLRTSGEHAGETSTSGVKMQRTAFDFSRGGTANDPLNIDDEDE
ncbi:hypothetical protein A4X13_0g6010 [Tilletia indica]|uniref:DUF7918 domain-containing protein n=1 Tax=Tilletia indica TaxID=43049 RepID=A0A177THQ1_9BASI|nr:hypothetical protein A4X13_0g6010 [Tilletia indica]